MNTESKGLPNRRLTRALADRYAKIVRRHAFRLMRRLPSHIQVEDLISAGYLGLADALQRRDGSRPEQFETYAEFRIRGAMLDELRARDPLSRDLRDLSKRIVGAVRALTIELGRPPEEIEIAKSLGIPVAEFREQLAKLSVGGMVSLDTTGSDDSDALEIGDEGSEAADGLVFRAERRSKLASVVDELPARLQDMLRLYYEQDYTFREIGEQLGLTESRVCQLHAEAIVRLRAAYLADDDHDEDLTSIRRLRLDKQGPEASSRSVKQAG